MKSYLTMSVERLSQYKLLKGAFRTKTPSMRMRGNARHEISALYSAT